MSNKSKFNILVLGLLAAADEVCGSVLHSEVNRQLGVERSEGYVASHMNMLAAAGKVTKRDTKQSLPHGGFRPDVLYKITDTGKAMLANLAAPKLA